MTMEKNTVSPAMVQRTLNQIKFAAKAWRDWSRDKNLPADRVVAAVFAENRKILGSRDRRFISGCVHEALRNQSYYEYWIQKFAQSDLRDPVKYAKFLCLLGAVSDGSVDLPLFAALWSEIKDRAQMERPEEWFNAVKSHAIAETQEEVSNEGWLALRYSFPLWLVQRWIDHFGAEECEALLAATHARPPFVIRVNTLKISSAEAIKLFSAEDGASFVSGTSCGIEFKTHPQVKNMEAFNDGLFEIQSVASQKVVEAIQPQSDDQIWDVCAGSGGKTLFLAALMQNSGKIIATDLRSLALKELKLRADRAGALNIKVADIQRFYRSETKDLFDKIVVDAPCSGSGTMGRAPDLKWRLEESAFKNFAIKQLEILEMALPYLKQTGKMFYITCSVDREENEGVVESFLKRHVELNAEMTMRILPHREKTDGFFMACFTYHHKENRV